MNHICRSIGCAEVCSWGMTLISCSPGCYLLGGWIAVRMSDQIIRSVHILLHLIRICSPKHRVVFTSIYIHILHAVSNIQARDGSTDNATSNIIDILIKTNFFFSTKCIRKPLRNVGHILLLKTYSNIGNINWLTEHMLIFINQTNLCLNWKYFSACVGGKIENCVKFLPRKRGTL